jgi:peptidoglycan-N-acetylglucosamine deacetylase
MRTRRLLAALAAACVLATPGVARAEPVALTFDDLPLNGPLAPGTTRVGIVNDVLALLRARRVPPVYGFVNAGKLEGNRDGAEALRHWVASGERVGNHTYGHLDLHEATPAQFLEDVRRDEPALELLDAGDAWHWLRYPYLREGDTLDKRRAVRVALAERGYRIAQVTLDYEDYLWNGAYARCLATANAPALVRLESLYLATASDYLDAGRQMAQLVFGRPIRHVLLLHLGAFSAHILPPLLDLLERKGFTLMTLEDAERDPAYDTDPDAASRNGGTLLEQLMDARGIAYPPIPPKPYRELEAICR